MTSTGTTRIAVGGERPYEVLVGHGLLGELPPLIGERAQAVALVHAAGLAGPARAAGHALTQAGYRVCVTAVPDGEAAKDAAVAIGLWSWLAEQKISRTDALVAVGGGAVTDLAGFVAASWLRGIRHVLVPTTLLGICDAAVGGKTAINIPAGKNLVGAFHPPAGVLADLDLLATLPAAEYRSGLAEVIKAGFIADPPILDLVEADPAAAAAAGGPAERELIERAIRMKVVVVSADLREAGQREMLNYGHTLGHAIERAEGYRLRHGEAVSIGMVFAATVAALAGRLGQDAADRHRAVLTSVGLPVSYQPGAWRRLRETMAVDKKTRGDRLRLIVLDGLAKPAILEDPPEDLLAQAYAEVSGR